MKLYGTTTSPFVRRVRVVAAELSVSYDRVDTATDDGMAALREITPIRKVPVAVVDHRTLFDSRCIIDWLTTTRGFGHLAPPRDAYRDTNVLNAIDAALDAVIQLFYLRRDGVPADGSPYATRQLERADAIFTWLASQSLSTTDFGLPELALVTALDWMDFRNVYPTAERAAALAPIRAAWRERPSLASTRPHV